MRAYNFVDPGAGAGLPAYDRLSRGLACGLLIAALLLFPQLARAGETKEFEVTIAGRKVTEGGPTIRVTEGDQVVIAWHSDEAGNLHLHGYDIVIELKPDGVTETRIDALVAGRFPVTSHGFGGQEHGHGEGALLYLEVYPE